MMANPDGAEDVLRDTPTAMEKLDYLLFLHAFRPPSVPRDATIRRLLEEIKREVDAKGDYWGKSDFSMRTYDGTDASLIPSIQAASLSGVAEFENPGYTIPCGVLKKRPAD